MKSMTLIFGLTLLFSFCTDALCKPKGESTVVGCLQVEMSGSYPKNPGPVSRVQEIRVACKYLDKTDTAGYFKLENVPAGKYVLKAVDFCFERASRITLASKFGRNSFGDNGRYWGMMNGMLMDNIRHILSDHIDSVPAKGVIDLGIALIQIRADISAADAGMGKSSPDGKPPWLRVNMADRGSMIDLFIMQDAVFTEMIDLKIASSGVVYNKLSPPNYYGLE